MSVPDTDMFATASQSWAFGKEPSPLAARIAALTGPYIERLIVVWSRPVFGFFVMMSISPVIASARQTRRSGTKEQLPRPATGTSMPLAWTRPC